MMSTTKTVIDMAREAGFEHDTKGLIWTEDRDGDCTEELKAFAELVRADERGIQREKTLAALMSIERKGDWITKEEAFEAIQRVEN
jgi:hypothetical protein